VYTIRAFEPRDMFAVIKIASDTLPERYNPSLFNYFYETYPQGFMVAEFGKKIIGFVVGVKINNETAKILMLSVSESYRKKQIGTKLLDEFLKKIKKEKIQSIELEVRTRNEKAIKFYEKHGFEIIEKLTDFYQNGEAGYIMRKRIIF
jgi:ribosomal-protein-alanine N-acetyltransferase